ncbi:MAG: DUF2141 domain-containing protein [Saonia sp.]
MRKGSMLFVLALITMGFIQETKDGTLDTGTITIHIKGIENKKGQIVFMLFDQEDGFPKEPDKAFKKGYVKEFTEHASFTFKHVPYGTYAIAVFHDEDSDGLVKSNFIGMPKESVGASNMTKMGKPSFKKCAIELKDTELKLDMVFII